MYKAAALYGVLWRIRINPYSALSLSFSSSPPTIGPEKGQKPSSFNRTPSNMSMAGLVAGMESGGWERDGTIETTGHPVSTLPHPPLAVPLVIGSGSPQLDSINDDQVGGRVQP